MDPVSQFAVGGVFGALFAPPALRALRRATGKPETLDTQAGTGAAILCAGLAAMTPDLDILIRDDSYPLMAIKYHRHFTHALAMTPLYALLLLPIARLMFHKAGMTWLQAFVLALLGLATHGVLDAMTNYGTHLWWPFTNARTSWNIISIVDPIFTPALLAAMLWATFAKSLKPLTIAFVFMLAYWGAGIYQREAAEGAMLSLAQTRGHTVVRHQVKPSFGNIILWRAQYEADGRIYTDAINVLPGRDAKVYEGPSTPLVVLDDKWLAKLPPKAQQDVRDFTFFSDQWISTVPGRDGLIGDARFAMLPNEPGPMWAVDTANPEASGHLPFLNLRMTPRWESWDRLWKMVGGGEVYQ